jgi:hypothetical protein
MGYRILQFYKGYNQIGKSENLDIRRKIKQEIFEIKNSFRVYLY